MKILIGIVVGLGLGAFCRWLDIPLPSPPKVVGAVMVLAVTLGFVAADWALTRGREKPSDDRPGSANVAANRREPAEAGW